MLEGLFSQWRGEGLPLQPVEIANKLRAAAEEAMRQFGQERIHGGEPPPLPDYYELILNPADVLLLQGDLEQLKQHLEDFLGRWAGETGHAVEVNPQIIFKPGDRIKRYSVVAKAEYRNVGWSSSYRKDQVKSSRDRRNQPRKIHEGTTPRSYLPAQSLPKAWLRLRTTTCGDDAGQSPNLIIKPLLSIGRDLDNDLVITDPTVSRHHACIIFYNGTFWLRPFRTRNKTFLRRGGTHSGGKVSAEVTAQEALGSGDMILLGNFEIDFILESALQGS